MKNSKYIAIILAVVLLFGAFQLILPPVTQISDVYSVKSEENHTEYISGKGQSADTNSECCEKSSAQREGVTFNDITDKLSQLFTGGGNQNSTKLPQVYLGGYPLGMTLDGNGVKVIGLNEFIGMDGKVVCPALDSGIKINDIILEINNVKISSSVQLAEMARNSDGNALNVTYMRQNKTLNTIITPQKELSTQQYRLGLWTKDSSSGVGTLTYIKKDLQFGSLGHPIYDSDGNIIKVVDGGVYLCHINGVVRGIKGKAGELKGSFDFNDKIGSIYLNNKYGVYGNFTRMPQYNNLQLIDVASVNQVRVGKAYVYCTVDGDTPQYYEIEIVKANNQQTMDDRGMVIHITDSRLIEKTGGIVQGMSGSPIIQNGKLVGAVTHVFVNDPTRGYGVYAQWMLEN